MAFVAVMTGSSVPNLPSGRGHGALRAVTGSCDVVGTHTR